MHIQLPILKMWDPDQIEAPDKKANSLKLQGKRKRVFRENKLTAFQVSGPTKLNSWGSLFG